MTIGPKPVRAVVGLRKVGPVRLKEMGHSNLETTMRYVDIWGAQAGKDAEAVARFLGIGDGPGKEERNGTV